MTASIGGGIDQSPADIGAMSSGVRRERTQRRMNNDLFFDQRRLRTVPLFAGLSEGSLKALLAGAVVSRFESGTTLFLQGDDANRFYVLLDGWVKLYRLTEDGTEAIVTVIARGETFAEAAVFASARFPVCAETVGAVTVLIVNRRELTAALAADHQIALVMLASLSARLRHLVERIEHLQIRSAPQRLGDFILSLCPEAKGPAQVDLPFAKALVAQRLGMRPETLSRSLAALRAHGVQASGEQVTIADIQQLRSFCDSQQ